jgi:uncharacterized protein YhaN
MSTSSWDDMKRVREDEYFKKQENQQTQQLQGELSKVEARYQQIEEMLKSFKKGQSPITGAPLFKAQVAGHIVLDCPADDMLMVSQATLLSLIESLQNDDKKAIGAWKAFLQN